MHDQAVLSPRARPLRLQYSLRVGFRLPRYLAVLARDEHVLLRAARIVDAGEDNGNSKATDVDGSASRDERLEAGAERRRKRAQKRT